jgi:predicted lipoprotein with Yx(FWY)xxD motif
MSCKRRRAGAEAGTAGRRRAEGSRANGVFSQRALTDEARLRDDNPQILETISVPKRTTQILTATVLAIAASAAIAVSSALAAPSAHSSSGPSVVVRHTAIGSILATPSGQTLYVFSRDHLGSNSCAKISHCSHSWPALTTRSRPTAGSGVHSSMLSTITVNGIKQITYGDHALYMFAGSSPGETDYVGVQEFGGTWEAINASGHLFK